MALANAAGAAAPDQDGDGIPDAADNCPRVANPGQHNSDALPAGDACQCGDVDGDGDVDLSDVSATRRSIDARAVPGFVAARCGSAGPAGCDAADGAAARRWLAGLAAGVPQFCPAAGLEFDPDANDDGVVNAVDGSIVGFCVGVDPAADCDCREADVDRDGDVDTRDLEIVSAHFNQSGFPQSPPDPGDAPSVTFVAPPEGALLAQTPVEVRLEVSDAGAAVSVNGVPAVVQAGLFVALVPLVEGPNTLAARAQGAACAPGTATRAVALDTLAPAVVITSPADGAETTDAAVPVTGTVSDPGARVRVNGVDAVVTGTAWRIDAFALAFGDNPLLATATDAAGNSASDGSGVRRLPRLEAIELTPITSRLTQAGATQPLALLGRYNDGSSADLTASPATAFEGSNAFVATVAAGGVVTAVSNGGITVTATHLGLADQASVTVEIGVLLESLEVTPPSSILRAAGAAQPLATRGRYSDGSTRDLTLAATGTTYVSSDPAIATVSQDGLVTALSPGQITVTVRNEALSGDASVRVVISTGRGFLRGEAFDDSLGLPLGGVTATLLADGTGPLAAPASVAADARGEYLLEGGPGDAVVRIARSGFTSVERRGEIFGDTALALLDARLTPLDLRANPIVAALGGAARNASGSAELALAPGALAANATLVLTEISNQGLQGRLPPGWSPVAALDVSPPGLAFGQPALARLPNAARLAAGSAVAAARYDAQAHAWIALAPGNVDAAGASIALALGASGQVVLLVPDAAPFTPPAPVIGEPLAGVPEVAVPANALAESVVLPPSAPAGIGARAVGVLALAGATPFPSGSVVEGNVTEQFDLFDLSTIRPQPFDQDLLVYARPRVTETAERGTRFPITPSRDFSLVELAIGMVKIDVDPRGTRVGGEVIGPAGGSASEAGGARLDVRAGAVGADSIAVLRARAASELEVPLESGLELVAAVEVDLVGAVLGAGGVLSLPTPAGLPAGAQVLVARRFRDLDGIARLELVGVARADGGRLISDGPLPGATPPGVTRGGEYLFVRPLAPLGFVAGNVQAPGGAAAQAAALVRSGSAPFAALTAANGAYLVAAAAGAPGAISAFHAPTRNSTSAQVQVAAGQVAVLALELGVVAPFVVETTPANGALDVLRNAPISLRFSEPIDPASVTDQGLVLAAGGVPVAGTRTLSPDGLELRFVPDGGLGSATAYTLAATSALRDLAGNALQPFVGVAFTTRDTSKPPQLAAGVIAAALPDADGNTEVVATVGTGEPLSFVTVTNPRTRETFTARAQTDGAFRLRVGAEIGDTLALTFRDAERREVQLEIAQFEDPDGTTAFGAGGGVVRGPGGRVARVLPRALEAGATFRMVDAAAAALPALPAGYAYRDRFELATSGAVFRRIASFELSESQGRFAPSETSSFPFEGAGSFFVPANFLVNGRLNFEAVVADAGGDRHRVAGATLVVGSSPDGTATETSFSASFPTVYLSAPLQAQPSQQVLVRAAAPTARIDFELPGAGVSAGTELLLARVADVGGSARLEIVDRLARATVNGTERLRSAGRDLPGATRGGFYAVVESSAPLASVAGQLTGPAQAVAVEGTPFVFLADAPNAGFRVPVAAGQPFSLAFVDPATGTSNGGTSGVAPGAGSDSDVGEPLAASATAMSVSATPAEGALVPLDGEIALRFSEAVDPRTLSASTLVVTDAAGNQVFGRFGVGEDAREVRFRPLRRLRFGTTYRYVVTRDVLGISGARLREAFAAAFSTFAPRVLASAEVDTARDVAVSGNLALVAGASGLRVLDVSTPDAPAELSSLQLPGGASGVALLEGVALTDRQGDPVVGRLALVSHGGGGAEGRVAIVGLNEPSAPVVLGSVRVSVPPGAPGTIVASGTSALVAVRGIGAVRVDLAQAIPADPGQPELGVAARYPTTGAEGVDGIARFETRALVAGAGGLSLLDATTLARVGGAATDGAARAVAALPQFEMDLDADGAIAPAERFDLAVVANGDDGTLQLLDLRNPAAPLRRSVIRLGHPALAVAVDSGLRLAFVGGGARGTAIVDLDGPASVQPIDLDADGIDDRILGRVASGGSAGPLALALARGIGYVADGARGLSVAQLEPPRTAFERVARDPLAAATGDEEALAPLGTAFLSDDRILADVFAALPPRTRAFLRVEESPAQGSARVLRLEGGAGSAPLPNGASRVALELREDAPASSSNVALVVHDDAGRPLARFDLAVVPGEPAAARLQSVFAAPPRLVLADAGDAGRVGLGGVFSDGRIRNLSAAAATLYALRQPSVASVAPGGLVTALSGGVTTLEVGHQRFGARAEIVVDDPTALVELRFIDSLVTLPRVSASRALRVEGAFADGIVADVTAGYGTTYESGDTAVATVGPDGTVTAVAEGSATITARNGAVSADARVFVESRPAASVTGIALEPFAGPVRADASLGVAATLSGSGALEGIEVRFEVAGSPGAATSAPADFGGRAMALLDGFAAPGILMVTASVVDPATGQTRSSSGDLVVDRALGDGEPNDDPAAAAPLDPGRPISGSVGGSDPADQYRVTSTTGGTLRVSLSLPSDVDLAQVSVVLRAANGTELARLTPPSPEAELAVAVNAGAAYVSIESALAQPLAYSLRTSFAQEPVVLSSVSPAGGAPGTAVTLLGSGFSSDPAEVIVLFGGVAAEVVSSAPGEIRAVVPANAADGPVSVVSRGRGAEGPAFVSGRAQPPPSELSPADPAMVRLDPTSGEEVYANRLLVTLSPSLARAQVDALASSLGARIAGFLPMFNTYALDFDGVQSLAALEQRRLQLLTSPDVLGAAPSSRVRVAQVFLDRRPGQDLVDAEAFWTTSAAELVRAPQALEQVRHSLAFREASSLEEVAVGVIDTGFFPKDFSEYEQGGLRRVTLIDGFGAPDARGLLPPRGPSEVIGGHGTAVTSVIAAHNNGNASAGLLNGVFIDEERAFRTTVYQATQEVAGRTLDIDAVWRVLEDVRLGYGVGEVIDVLNLSFSSVSPGVSPCPSGQFFRVDTYCYKRSEYRQRLRALTRTLVVAAAGNDGEDARYALPAALSQELDNVVTVAGVAVEDKDTTGERRDRRALFTLRKRLPAGYPADARCDALVNSGSACGPAVTLAAPAEDVVVADTDPRGGQTRLGTGTSIAAPVVTAVAALLQSIRGSRPPFAPSELRDLLVRSADDISVTWEPNLRSGLAAGTDMKRLNALAAVRLLLPPQELERVYVADQEHRGDYRSPDPIPGKLIALDVDLVTGIEGGAEEVLLALATQNASYQGMKPTMLSVSPDGDELWVVVESVDPALGDGLLVYETAVDPPSPLAFVGLGGAEFPARPGPPAAVVPVRMGSNRAAPVFSKDGRLLYVSTGPEIAIVNTVDRKLVRTLRDLPEPYRAHVTQADEMAFADARQRLRDRMRSGVLVLVDLDTGYYRAEPLVELGDLAISPDGRRLYASGRTGPRGGGRQPGALIALDVDLFRDRDPARVGAQPDLARYFALDYVVPQHERNLDPAGIASGDEPEAVVASPDGKHVYMLSQGAMQYRGVPPDELRASDFYAVFGAASIMLTTGLSGGIAGALGGLNSYLQTAQSELDTFLGAYVQSLGPGHTFLEAPGDTAVFAADERGALEWFYPANVTRGWNASSGGVGTAGGTGTISTPILGGGRVLNQSSVFRALYTARPRDMAIRPDGRRAIVGFFQTGNFGILDLDTQRLFASNPPSAPEPFDLYADPDRAPRSSAFHDLVAVTPSPELDTHLWPDRGRLRVWKAAGGANLISGNLEGPEERLLFVHDVEYAQSGRFAVATHAGGSFPRRDTGSVMDWRGRIGETKNRIALQQLGFVVNDAAGTALRTPTGPNDQDSTNASVGVQVEFDRGGGALTILDDRRIGQELAANASRTLDQSSDPNDPQPRAYYGSEPLEGAERRVIQYQEANLGWRRFWRPRGLAIQPVLSFESPRFGDRVQRTTGIAIGWRTSRALALVVRTYDLDEQIPDPADPRAFELIPRQVGERRFAFTASERDQLYVKAEFRKLFSAIFAPVSGHRYRVVAELYSDPVAGDLLATTDLHVTFEEPAYRAPRPPNSCDAQSVSIWLEAVQPRVGGAAGTPGVTDPDTRRVLAPMLFGGNATLRYRIEPPAGRGLDSQFGVRLRLADGTLLVSTAPAQRNTLQGDFSVEIERPVSRDPDRRYAAQDFEVALDYGFEGCLGDIGGLRSTEATIPVVSNSRAFLQSLTPSLVEDDLVLDGCSATFGGITRLRSAISALSDRLGYDLMSFSDCDVDDRNPAVSERLCTGSLRDDQSIIAVDLANPIGGDNLSVIELFDSTAHVAITREIGSGAPGTAGRTQQYIEEVHLSRPGTATAALNYDATNLRDLQRACPGGTGVQAVELDGFSLQIEFQTVQSP